MKSPLLALAISLATTAALAAPVRPEVIQPWSRPAAAGTTGVGYMVLANRGRSPDALVAISSPVASMAMIHRSSTAGGMASMQMVNRVELPPDGTVTFGPGGYHVMFTGLKKPLAIGDTLPATLTFASGAKVTTAFQVRVNPPGR